MEELDLELRRWAVAAEIWQLSRTDLPAEDWAKHSGRCQPMKTDVSITEIAAGIGKSKLRRTSRKVLGNSNPCT